MTREQLQTMEDAMLEGLDDPTIQTERDWIATNAPTWAGRFGVPVDEVVAAFRKYRLLG